MAEIVSSAVVQETLSKVLSGLVQKYEEKEESNGNRNLERLEMAHIRLEAALETSERWQITDTSMSHWRWKLKRAAQECDDSLHKCKQRILESEQMEQRVRNSSFPNRIAHATKSFVSSIINCDDNKLRRSTVQRFEWFANGATEFLRFVELRGTPRSHIPFYSLVNNIFAGKELHHKIIGGNQHPAFELWLAPFGTTEHGTEASLIFIQTDDSPSVGNIYFSIVLQVPESTDIFGTAIQCLQLFAPYVKCTVENIMKELTQLPTQCLSWVPSVYSNQQDRVRLQNRASQWMRPNSLCCKKHHQHELQHISNPGMVGWSDAFLEPVTEVNLQCQVSLSPYNKQKTLPFEDTLSLQDSSYLKAGIYFAPHRSLGHMLPANRSSEIVAIVGEDQHCLHVDVTLEQLEGIMLPKAIDYFHKNTEATIYKMIWKSKHSSALIQVEKASMSTQNFFFFLGKRKLLQGQDKEFIRGKFMISHLFYLWRVHVPVQLISAFKDWLQKEPQLYLKF
ncbi:hypothetical protein PAHAL_2G014200 [Panicum hallii]|uniref:Disease resistance N-terminal domain-containing protein n=1 Tax=Panicum hallii TaxID=206008 RepID=A0A2T8KMF0_9POAL|nr:hypothetical protein PAHAL_2G014200 [Panicum hallii]